MEGNLEFSLPAIWLKAPPERTQRFFTVYSAVSLALQRELRRRIPEEWFSDPARFENVRLAWPLLLWQASLPLRPRSRNALNYDVLDNGIMKRYFREARIRLPNLLEGVQSRILAEGHPALAQGYEPKHAGAIAQFVESNVRCRARLEGLLVAEAALINGLVRLAGFDEMSRREQTLRVQALTRIWNAQLRAIYTRQDFRWLLPELLETVSRAFLESTCELNAPPRTNVA
ncbi:MAG: hypothetical protein M3O35_00770 [Acidobacteriota bacterium]|nr:hypothetical protein [Acidobacteriota bacterium]